MNAKQIESELKELYAEQDQHYRAAADLLKQKAIKRAGDYDEVASHLQALISRINLHETRLAKLREQWLASGRKPGPQLQSTMSNVEYSLRETITLIDEASQQMQKSKERLLPQLSEVARHQQMRSAYDSTT